MPTLLSEPVTLSRSLRCLADRRPFPGYTAIEPKEGWVKELQAAMNGRVVVPEEADYDHRRRLFDPRFDPKPMAIALCTGEGDVRACLAVARQDRVPFTIRGGGHSFAGYSGGDGLIVDVSGLDSVVIAKSAMTLTVGGGCQQGRLAGPLAQAGLHVPTGDWGDVCIGGYMQGGGFGGTSRTFGMNSDSVLSIRMMLADGRVVTASETANHDLWWAVRGGTGNTFGVVLEITYRLHQMPPLARFVMAFSLAPENRQQGIDALLAYQSGFMASGAPDTLNSSAVIAQSFDPARGGPWLAIEAIQIGTLDELLTNVEPLLGLPGLETGFDERCLVPPSVMPPFARTSRLIGRTITGDEWRDLLAVFDTSPNPQSQVFLRAHGGKINSYPRERSAFIHRDAHCNMFMDVYWPAPEDRPAAEAFRERWRAHVEPLGNGHIYQNFPETDAPDYEQNYWGAAYPALAAVKAKYDPACLFDFPQAVRPGSAADVSWPPSVVNALAAGIVADPAE